MIGKVTIAHRDRTRSRLEASRLTRTSSSFNSNHDVSPRSGVSLQSVSTDARQHHVDKQVAFSRQYLNQGGPQPGAQCRMLIDDWTYLTADARAFWAPLGTPMGSSARCVEESCRRFPSRICRPCPATWTALRWRHHRRKRGARLRPYRSVTSISCLAWSCIECERSRRM